MAEKKQECGACEKPTARLIFFVPDWSHVARTGAKGLCKRCFGAAQKATKKAVKTGTEEKKGA